MLKGMTLKTGENILARVGSEKNFFDSSRSSLSALLGFDSKLLDESYRTDVLRAAENEMDFVKANNLTVIYFRHDENYPARLADCDDAPVLLYALGECDLNNSHVISVVGTRHATPYGIGFVKELIVELSEKIPGVLIVSGLAYGIDIAAHREALLNKLPTVAVLAHGLSTIYPAAHRKTAVEMVRNHGMLLTDYPHSARMHRGNFIARNRIVAGLSEALVVVESAEKGGAIITANIASSYDREVFALPGRISDTYSRGCNRLVNENKAALVQSCDDLIKAMGWKAVDIVENEKRLFENLSPEEEKVVLFLQSNGEAQINRMAVELDMRMHRLMGVLVDMEFKGLILSYPGALYRLA